MTIEATEGGWYFIHVDQDTLSVYVRLIPNDIIEMDDDFEYIYERRDDKLVRFTHPVSSGSCSGGCSGGCAGSGAGAFTDHPISISIDGVKYYYLYDGLGSVTELIDESENVVNMYRYSPFGDALIREEAMYNPHQFTGRQYDAESGLYHYRARAYSADIGRFMQQDPAGMVDGANMYAYCGNDPVNKVDPKGEVGQFVLLGALVMGVLGLNTWRCVNKYGAIARNTYLPGTYYGFTNIDKFQHCYWSGLIMKHCWLSKSKAEWATNQKEENDFAAGDSWERCKCDKLANRIGRNLPSGYTPYSYCKEMWPLLQLLSPPCPD